MVVVHMNSSKMSNIICKQILPPDMRSTWFRCSRLPCPLYTVPSSYLIVIKMKLANVHCSISLAAAFSRPFYIFFLFNTAYRRQKGTIIPQTGEREDCCTRLQPHACAFYWRQSDCKIYLCWLQRNSSSFYFSTGAVNQGWDVAWLQIRTLRLLLAID